MADHIPARSLSAGVADAASITPTAPAVRPPLRRSPYSVAPSFSNSAPPAPPAAFSSEWRNQHLPAAYEAYLGKGDVSGTLTSFSAALTAAAQAAEANKIFTAISAGFNLAAAGSTIYGAISNGHVVPALASTFSAVGSGLLAAAPFIKHDTDTKNKVEMAGRACVAVGVYLQQHDTSARQGVAVAQRRINGQTGTDNDLEMGSAGAAFMHPVPGVPVLRPDTSVVTPTRQPGPFTQSPSHSMG